MPRPTKLTAQAQERILTALRVGATYEHAAQLAGISYRTFRNWMERGERANVGRYVQFFQAVKRAEAEAAVRWLAKIEQAANDGQWQAAAWKLERRYPEQWGRRDRMQVQHSGEITLHPEWLAIKAVILRVAAAHPDVREELLAGVEAIGAGDDNGDDNGELGSSNE